MNKASVTIDTNDVTEGIKKAITAINSGILKGMIDIRDETYDYAKKRLDLFKHTTKKESYKGLVKPPVVKTKKGVVVYVNQKSISGSILEYKIDTAGKGGIISLNSSLQPRSHPWLRENNMIGTRIKKDSQIAITGPKKNVMPMQDAFDKITMIKGPTIVANGIRKELIRKL